MALFTDLKYLGLISSRLERFKHKGSNLYNFRCPYCGDSKKNKYKARGYLFPHQNTLVFKCHNCNMSTHISKLIEFFDTELYKEYRLEVYKDDMFGRKPEDPPPKYKPTKTVFERNILGKLERCDRIPRDHPCVEYLASRKIPETKWDLLYHIDDMTKFETWIPQYKDRIYCNDSRLVIPFFTREKKVFMFVCRALTESNRKYIYIKLYKDFPSIYGLERINLSKTVYVLEGQLDTFFVDNSLSVGGSDFLKMMKFFPRARKVMVFDNEPRHKQVCDGMQRLIDADAPICIWPETPGKDPNEMFLNGWTREKIMKILRRHTFSGLKAQLKFNEWRKYD